MSKNNAQQSNVVQQIEELKNKIQLLEGDTKAYYESSQFTIKKNTEKISKLRKENKELRKCQADKLSADEHVVCEGLKDHPTQKHALKGKPAPVAISIMDQKHCELLKKLNAERHVTAKKQKRLEQLKTKQDQMTKDAKDAVETDAGESDEAQTLRSLENRLDKAELKCKEAEHIQRTYMQIKEKLEKEHENHSNMLDDGENEIRRLKQEKKELETMQNDAVIARDAAKEELVRLEKHLYEERKKREIELQQMKKEAEEKRIQQEKIMTRIATQTGMQSGEEVSAEQHLAIQEEEEQRRISSYEDVFRRIKDATGVSETKDVIWRFENQDETTRHLEELKATNEVEIARLREDKDKLQKDFEEMKYSGEAKMSSGQRMLEECEMHVAAEEKRMDISKDRLDKSSRVLTDAKSGIEHLAKKLFAIKTQSSQVQKSKISPTSDEYVLDQLSISEEKLLKLLEELEQSGKDVDELSRLIEEEDFHNTVDQNLPKHNVRVKLPTTKTEAYIGDEESGDDDEILSREGLKKQSQQIVDAKTRRRPGKKKKGK